MITLSSSGDTIGPVVTSDTSYTFNNTVMLTGDISVSVVAFNGNTMGTSIQVAAQPSLLSKRFMHTNKFHGNGPHITNLSINRTPKKLLLALLALLYVLLDLLFVLYVCMYNYGGHTHNRGGSRIF